MLFYNFNIYFKTSNIIGLSFVLLVVMTLRILSIGERMEDTEEEEEEEGKAN